MTPATAETVTGSSRGRRSVVVSPEYGTVSAALGYAITYAFVDAITPHVLDALPADLVSPVGTAFAVLLWLGLVGNVITELRRQLADNPRRFDDEGEHGRFLRRRRPSRAWLAVVVPLAAVGAVVVWTTWEGVVATAVGLVVALATLTFPDAFLADPVGVAVFVAFWVSFGLVTYGVDRVATGALREAQYRLGPAP